MKKLFLVIMILLFAGSGCAPDSSDTSGVDTDTSTQTEFSCDDCGAIKGPLQPGSAIGIGPVDSSLEPMGEYFPAVTEGWFGKFNIGTTFTNPYVSTTASGYYLVENTGEASTSQITLRAYSDLSVSSKIVINLLTTLSYKRIKYLVVNESMSITDSKAQAKVEVLAVFKIYTSLIESFDQMDIAVDDEKGGILLAVSVIIQQGNTDAQTSSLVYDISLDIEEDGTLDNPALTFELAENAKAVNLAEIKANVENYYAQNGQNITLSKYMDYIDSDGDGIINLSDDNIPDVISFVSDTHAEFTTVTESNTVTISGITGTVAVTGTAYKNGTESTDFTVSNGDQIKFILTSSPNYSTAVSSIITISEVVYTYSVTTKADDRQQIIVFDSGKAAMDGAFGFANAQTWCSAEATFRGINGTIIPYLSSDAFDSGTEFADEITEDPINPRQIQSLTGGLIASRWSKFFDNESTDSFLNLGIVNNSYWTGMNDGLTTYNCNQWQNNGNTINNLDFGNYNNHDVTDRTTAGSPQSTIECDQLKKILCIAY